MKGRTIDEELLDRTEEYILGFQRENGRSPSFREIMKRYPKSFPSLSKVQRYVSLLKQNERIESESCGKIGIDWKLKVGQTVTAPLLGTVTCGEPLLAVEEFEGNFQLPVEWFGYGEMFMLRARGTSMIGVGIHNGDIVVVRRQDTADYGQTVVALLGEEALIKTYYPERGRIILHPENPTMKDRIVAPEDCKILGIVSGCIHRI